MKRFGATFLSLGLAVALMSQSVTAGVVLAEDPMQQSEESQIDTVQETADYLLINQVYGGGGKGDTPIGNSFIELYNPTPEDISLKGYTLSFDENTSLELADTVLKSGTSWLIVCKAEETSDEFLTCDLPEADQTWDIAINNKNYTLALKNGDTEIDSATADESVSDIKVSKQKSLRRVNYVDTDTNDDWDVIVWEKGSAEINAEYVANFAPRNSKGEYGSVHTVAEPDDPEKPSYTPVVTSDEKVSGVNNEDSTIQMQLYARYNSGAMNADGGSLEIVEYNDKNGYAYAVSGLKGQIIAIQVAGIEGSDKVTELSGQEYDVKSLVETAAAEAGFVYGDITSVAVSPDGAKLAAAVQHAEYDKSGKIAVFSCEKDGSLSNPQLYDAGVQPDMVTFADGDTVLTADEGEPRNGYGGGCVDPAGSVTVLNLTDGISSQVGFEKYTAEELIAKNIIVGVANGSMIVPETDLEPEYIALSSDGRKAYVSLQEANAIAVLDVDKKEFTGIFSTGYQDYSKVAVDIVEDGKYEASTYENLIGARMPDGIAVYENGGKTYVLTANEGDAREWGDYLNEAKTKEFTGKNIRILDSTKCAGLPEGKSVMFGGRSFSIFEVTADGLTEVFDSGNDLESITAKAFPEYFNCSNDDNEADSRSPKKGPEPENVVVGQIEGKSYAFVAIERVGGIIAYDITDSQNSIYVNYINSRDFSEAIKGDVSPEGLCVAQADGKNVLLAACEVSGTLAAYELTGTAEVKHNYITEVIPAELNKDGKILHKCSDEGCAFEELISVIPALKQVSLSKTTYVYDGKAKKPTVVLKDKNGNVISSENYTVAYQANKSVGKATVIVTLKGNYSGKITKSFTIVPKGSSIKKVSGSKKAISVKWKKQSTQSTGYQIQYSTSKAFTKNTTRTVTIKKNKVTSTTLKKLKANKKYYVRVRVYKTVRVSGKTTKVYSSWSKAKAVKTK